MRIGVLGTGEVGRGIGAKLLSVGHEVMLGSRTSDNEAATSWAKETEGEHGTFADAAEFGEVIVNATGGLVSLQVFESAGAANLRDKVIVDVSNALDFSEGFPPKLPTANGKSVAEQIQDAYPEAHVVKTLNTMNWRIMVDPASLPGDHNVFVSADDAAAKSLVRGLLTSLGWRPVQIIDLGGLQTALGAEYLVGFWVHLVGATNTNRLNFAVIQETTDV